MNLRRCSSCSPRLRRMSSSIVYRVECHCPTSFFGLLRVLFLRVIFLLCPGFPDKTSPAGLCETQSASQYQVIVNVAGLYFSWVTEVFNNNALPLCCISFNNRHCHDTGVGFTGTSGDGAQLAVITRGLFQFQNGWSVLCVQGGFCRNSCGVHPFDRFFVWTRWNLLLCCETCAGLWPGGPHWCHFARARASPESRSVAYVLRMNLQMFQCGPEVLKINLLILWAAEDGLVHKEEGSGMEEDENIWGHFQETWIWTDVNTGCSFHDQNLWKASQLWSHCSCIEEHTFWVLFLQWFGFLSHPGDCSRQIDHVGRHCLRYVWESRFGIWGGTCGGI